MGIADKVWEALAQVIKMNEQIVRLSGQVKELAAEMRELDKRLVRIETMLEVALSATRQAPRPASPRKLPPRG